MAPLGAGRHVDCLRQANPYVEDDLDAVDSCVSAADSDADRRRKALIALKIAVGSSTPLHIGWPRRVERTSPHDGGPDRRPQPISELSYR